MPMNDGTPINRDAVFDKFAIGLPAADSLEPTPRSYLYLGDQRVGEIVVDDHYMDRHYAFDETDPEVIEIQRRLDAGECNLYYELRRDPYTLHPWNELQETVWYLATVFPFHERGVDPHHFFHALSLGADYTPGTHSVPQKFHFPGLVVDKGPQRYYEREDNAQAPDVRTVNDLILQGWHTDVPLGPHALYMVEVTDFPDALHIGQPMRVYHRRKDVPGAIRRIARAWYNYWNGLTSGEQGINVRMTARKHFEHAIGRVWASMPLDDDIEVFYEGSPGTRATRPARDAEDWLLGNLELWANQFGFPAFMTFLNIGGNRGVLESELGDYTFCHINHDGTLGDRLANPPDGLLEATWDAYQDTHYPAAVGTLISVSAGDDQTVDSAASVTLSATATVVHPSGATSYQWTQESGDTVVLASGDTASATFTAPTLVAGAEAMVLVFKVTATNNGENASDRITVTVNPPASP